MRLAVRYWGRDYADAGVLDKAAMRLARRLGAIGFATGRRAR
jgi:hypothetical protein